MKPRGVGRRRCCRNWRRGRMKLVVAGRVAGDGLIGRGKPRHLAGLGTRPPDQVGARRARTRWWRQR